MAKKSASRRDARKKRKTTAARRATSRPTAKNAKKVELNQKQLAARSERASKQLRGPHGFMKQPAKSTVKTNIDETTAPAELSGHEGGILEQIGPGEPA